MPPKNPLPGILSPFQEEILRLAAALPESDRFYLTGGTALAAFYLGHRLSEDFDLFTSEEVLPRLQGPRLVKSLSAKGWQVNVTRNLQSFYECTAGNGTESMKIQFAADSSYRLAPVEPSVYGVALDSLEDISSNKLLALCGRFALKDFIDIFFLVHQAAIPLETMMERAGRKDPGFDPYYLAVAFEKARDFPDEQQAWPVQMVSPLTAPSFKDYFIKQAVFILGQAPT